MGRALGYLLITLCVFAAGCESLDDGAAQIEDAIVFRPRAYPHGDWTPEPRTEDVWFDSTDGVRLNGWFAEPEGNQPRAVVLFTHGNGGNVAEQRQVIRLLRDQLNASVLVFDYRGYGRSGGIPTEAGLLDDARAARHWLAKRTGVRESDIVLVGHSLGGAVAVDLAAKDGARGLVLECTFSSLPDVATSQFPLFPYRSTMKLHFDSIAKIPAYRGPLLQVHGDGDRIVPEDVGRKLFAAANEPKTFITVPGGSHNDYYSRDYIGALDRFLGSLPRP